MVPVCVQHAAHLCLDFSKVDIAGNTVMVWVMAWVKLVLEWVTVPLFVIALQLPQGAVWYWLTSSLSAMAQV